LGREYLEKGRFGTALNATYAEAEAERTLPAYKSFPITIELWCKLNSCGQYNILVAHEPKESAEHWEIYTEKEKGALSAYFPGLKPAVIASPVKITDSQWHFVAMVVNKGEVALYVDGKEAVKTTVEKQVGGEIVPGKLTIGAVGSLTCDGIIDDLRISQIAREIREIPNAPQTADASTIGLWSFDKLAETKIFADASANANPVGYLSLSERDRISYRAGRSPLDSPVEAIALQEGSVSLPAKALSMSLDGDWQLVEGGSEEQRLSGEWNKTIAAHVPGSVHTALYRAGIIPFPYEGRNQEIVKDWSAKTYWYRKNFSRPPKSQDQTLVFHGVCNRCTIWLNGKELGKHEGMFTRIEFPIHDLLQDDNTLIVKLDPAIPWQQTVVFNNSYGWHYSKFPPLGIWQSVEICGKPAVELQTPLLATRDAQAGVVDLVVDLAGPQAGWSGTLKGTIAPDNFKGISYQFESAVQSSLANKDLHFRFTVPNPQLWWPVDLGKPNLYKLTLAFTAGDGKTSDVKETTFGIRTIRMAPINGRPHPRRFDWTFVVNGKPMFVKGTGWCTCDAMMDFSRARYDRQLTLAVSQHIQMLRVWGSGMVETDTFYDLCNRKGIMVMQEWPTAWESHLTQPYDLLEQTVRENVVRLRNHPSLAIYTGGNESCSQPFGKAIDMMGRLNVELDGTRDFHRGEPWGGSEHNYDIYWQGKSYDLAFTMQAPFYGEFGIASYPNYESMQRVLPDDEKKLWPPAGDKSFAYHTPIFNTASDLDRQTRMSQYFTAGENMERYIIGTQLAQGVAVRHALERARSRWPECTGALYYKLNDNSPAASWSTVDWFGAPKISHYLIQRSYSPLLAVALFPKGNLHGESAKLPIILLNDADALNNSAWEVRVRAYGSDLKQIKEQRFSGHGSIKQTAALGEFFLTAEQTKTMPLMVVTEVMRNGELTQRNDYVMNYEAVKDCLFKLPTTRLAMQIAGNTVSITNRGSVPAVGVHLTRKGHQDTFMADHNYFWLEPGETNACEVNEPEGLTVEAWNATDQ
jgi:beta-mannosidase